MKTYHKESIKNDKLGRYVVGPYNIKYYIDETRHWLHKYRSIRCMEAVRIEELSSKCESVDQIDRVRIEIYDGNFYKYEYFSKEQIRQDDVGYYVQFGDIKYYLDNDKLIMFPEQSPTDYLYVEAFPLHDSIIKEIEKSKLYFSFNSWDLNLQSNHLLNDVARRIRCLDHTMKIKIIGHTDNLGSAAVNRIISHRRAKNVLNFLVNNCGLNQNHFLIEGLGEDFPTAPNKTRLYRSKNRRVEFRIVR